MKSAVWFVVLLWGISTAGPFLIPLCLAAFLAFLMLPVVRSMREKKIPEWICLILSSTLLFVPAGVLVFVLVQQGQKLISQLPEILQSLKVVLADFLPLTWVEKLISETSKDLTTFSDIANGFSRTLLVGVLAVLMLANRDRLKRAAEHLVSRSPALNGPALVKEVPKLIQKYLFARFWIGLGVGVFCFLAFSLLNVPYSILLGGFLGLMTFMPAIGYIIALMPIVVVALSSGHPSTSVLGICGVVLFCNIIDAYYLTPKLVGNRVNINALMVFVGLFGGGLIWGVWGIFLSVPILSVLRIFLSSVPTFEPWGDILTSQTDSRVIRLFKKKPKPPKLNNFKYLVNNKTPSPINRKIGDL